MPGLAKTRFTKDHEKLALKVSSEINACEIENYETCQFEIIEKYTKLLNHKSEISQWTHCGASCIEGKNLVVQVQSTITIR